MLHFIYANDLRQHPLLEDTMFRDRACQFKNRLDWDVTVNAQGHERDEYDDLNPLFLERFHSCGPFKKALGLTR